MSSNPIPSSYSPAVVDAIRSTLAEQRHATQTHELDLSHEGVDRILAALADAGLTVDYNETDGDTALDIWLTELDGTPATILSWRETEGWVLRHWDEFSGDTNTQTPDRKWPIAAGSVAEVARDVAAILAEPEPEAERPGLTAITDITSRLCDGWVHDSTTAMADRSTERVWLHPSGRQITATTDPFGTTELTMTGLDLTQVADAITAAGLTATAETAQDTPGETTGPGTLQQRVAAELHRIADDIVRLNLPVADTMCATLGLGVLDSRADLERWAGHLGSEVKTNPNNNIPSTEHRILLDGRPYGPWLTVRAQIQPDEPSEVERLRARVAELEAERTQDGAR